MLNIGILASRLVLGAFYTVMLLTPAFAHNQVVAALNAADAAKARTNATGWLALQGLLMLGGGFFAAIGTPQRFVIIVLVLELLAVLTVKRSAPSLFNGYEVSGRAALMMGMIGTAGFWVFW